MKLKRFSWDERGEIFPGSFRHICLPLLLFPGNVHKQSAGKYKDDSTFIHSCLKDENVMMIMIFSLTSRMIKITNRIIHNAIRFMWIWNSVWVCNTTRNFFRLWKNLWKHFIYFLEYSFIVADLWGVNMFQWFKAGRNKSKILSHQTLIISTCSPFVSILNKALLCLGNALVILSAVKIQFSAALNLF